MAPLAKVVRYSRPVFLWVFPAAAFIVAMLLGRRSAILSPDAAVYRMLAVGPRAAVPAPFSARILGPAAAQWLGRVTGLGVDNGFLLLGILSLVALLIAIAYLLRFQKVQAGLFAAIFLMPFWLKLFNSYYLPDLLHAAILALLLACMVSGRVTLAMLLLFPAYLTRESTLLTALCLAWAAWRRVSFRAMLAGLLATLGGMLISRHFVHLGGANVKGIGAASYLFGKLVWSFFRNIFGLPLWTNALALPGCNPMWTAALPHWLHPGSIRLIGLCPPSVWGPARVLLAWFGVFGIGPAVAAVCIRAMLSRRAMAGDAWPVPDSLNSTSGVIAFRFSVIYGILTFFLAPLLGASVDRLTEYAWPFFFIALPWFVSGLARAHPDFPRRYVLWLLSLHLAACWIAWVGFSREEPATFYLYAGLFALGLNIIAYVAVLRLIRSRLPALLPASEGLPCQLGTEDLR